MREPATSPAGDAGTPRIDRLCLLVLVLVVVLLGRLFELQILKHATYRDVQIGQVDQKRAIPARRGRILDRRGRVLAFDVVAYDVAVMKPRFRDRDLALVAAALGMDVAAARQRLRRGGRFVRLAREVPLSPEIVRRLATVPGLCLDRSNRREYPYGTLAAAYLGFMRDDGHGAEGIEKAFDAVLRGTPGTEVVFCGVDGEPVSRRSETQPVEGRDIVLTLDVELQRIAEEALGDAVRRTGARSGSVLVLDPENGDVLACANAPRPRSRSQAYDPAQWRNHAFFDQFEPGSTLKPVIAAAALRHGAASPQTWIYAERGRKRFGSAGTIHDAHREGDGWLTFEQAFARSSNICFAKLARKLTSQQVYEEYRAWGFGTRTGLPFSGEPAGQLALPRDWSGRTRLTLGYGQEISATALQLANLYVAIANGGTLMQPRIVQEIRAVAGTAHEAVPVRAIRRVADPGLAATLRELCRATVRQGGTATRAGVEGLDVAGKTGTAEKAVGGRYVPRYVASFAGFAPAEDPQLVVLVVLDEPDLAWHYGGLSAAPAFRQIVSDAYRSTDWLRPRTEALQIVRARDLQEPLSPMAAPLRVSTWSDGAVPDLRGFRLRAASRWLHRLGVVPEVRGAGVVRAQWPPPGDRLLAGETVRLVCRPPEAAHQASFWPR